MGSGTPVENGIFLITLGRSKFAVLVRIDPMTRSLSVDVIGPTKHEAAALVSSISEAANATNVYRGKVISLTASADRCGVGGIQFHALPNVDAFDIILPAKTLELMVRNTVGFFQRSDVLTKAGRSAKRGLLIHGKPGTGKTLTARWLAQSVPGATVLLMSGDQLWMVKECCQIARMLAPSLVIMEDVDLIATARDASRHPAFQVTLHQLLNEMDGVDSEAPVLFLLTTNRPDEIEPALASRPGRIDQAIEYPLPDADCRLRLMDLYGKGLRMQIDDMPSIISRTDGASPAFIRELLRKALLFAAEEADDEEPTVADRHVRLAIEELIVGGGSITRNLLGFRVENEGVPTK